MYRLFLVEDDDSLAQAMKQQLESYGYDVVLVRDFHKVLEEFRAANPQLVLMDIMLPTQNGYYWTEEIRKESRVPIVFLSSASDNLNLVMAISMGGDDFIAKPVEPMVLHAKLSAVLRRTYELNDGHRTIEFCGAALSLDEGVVRTGDRTVELTKNEFRILQTLLENKGKIVSREALMLKLWNDDCFVEENTLTVNVTRLRRKLEDYGLTNVIVTKPGSGYLIR